MQPVSKEDIERLPGRARLAFAARCARRCFIVVAKSAQLSPLDIRALDTAVTLMEDLGNGGDEADRASAAAIAHHLIGIPRMGLESDAIWAAAYAVRGLASGHVSLPIGEATMKATRSAQNYLKNVGSEDAIRSDLDRLDEVAEREGWDDNTPVPPQFFDPLPDPELHSSTREELEKLIQESRPEPQITVYFDDDVLSDNDKALFVEYLSSTYREVAGGIGLKPIEGKAFSASAC